MNFRNLAFADTGYIAGLGAPPGGYRDAATVRGVQIALTVAAEAEMAANPGPSLLSPGPVDGVYGPNTARAIKALQGRGGEAETGEIDEWVLTSLGVPVPKSGPSPAPKQQPGGGPQQPPPTTKDDGSWAWWALGAAAAVVIGRKALRRRSAPA